jgi:hypothetical protein
VTENLKRIGIAALMTTVALFAWQSTNHAAETPAAKDDATDMAAEIRGLRSEIERLKGLTPSQSHTMADVAYHFTNLWFAADKKNWPLAQFNLEETRSHLRWAVRVIPIRKDLSGNQVVLDNILTPIEQGPLKKVEEAIQAQDKVKFKDAYTQMLNSCHGCHVAVGKPFLKLHIPDRPENTIIDYNP